MANGSNGRFPDKAFVGAVVTILLALLGGAFFLGGVATKVNTHDHWIHKTQPTLQEIQENVAVLVDRSAQ